jgi:hypothetical protein
LILVAGLIHLVLTPAHLEEATYLGLLFFANFVGTAAAAFGVWRGFRWGWALGALIAGGAYALYFVNGTVGLPGVEHGHLLEPLGLFVKAVEAFFLILCALVLAKGLGTEQDADPLRHQPRRPHGRDSDHVRDGPPGQRVKRKRLPGTQMSEKLR